MEEKDEVFIFLLLVFFLESTWGAYAFHISWNLLAMIFGEWDEGVGIFAMTDKTAEATSFFTPDFSLGGTLSGVIVNVVLILILVVYAKRKKRLSCEGSEALH